MGLPFAGIGILFDIDGLGSGSYGYKARQIFMKQIDPSKIAGCLIMHGDTRSTIDGYSREFCIAVYGVNLDVESVEKVIKA